MPERTEAEMREWAKTLETSFLWHKIGDVLQPIVMPPVIGGEQVVNVFDDRTKTQLARASHAHDWDEVLRTIKSFTSRDTNYVGHFWLKEEVGESAWRSYPHDFTRVQSLVEGDYRYFGDIRERGEAYKEMYVLLDEIVDRSKKS